MISGVIFINALRILLLFTLTNHFTIIALLRELLKDNEITNFDPLAEAFKAYDPQGTGFVDTDVLRNVFQNLGSKSAHTFSCILHTVWSFQALVRSLMKTCKF